ncbi:MAG TPA: ABC transporter substrate-binding protein [Candidatus Saccharimonadales bacterium]|nr:ABC transporter substrate-binding protein [Candidatus Saccharimonadales bacterium]
MTTAREPSRPRRGVLPSLALSLVLAAACGGPPPPADGDGPPGTPRPETGGEMVIAGAAEPQDLNCLRAADSPSVSLCRIISGTLLDYDKDLRIVPRLARSFEASPDGLTITFHLRDDVRWHDGKPFTSRDVVYTVGKIRDPESAIRGNLPALFGPIESVEAPDDTTVVVRYREPYALAYQAWTRAFIMPAHLPFGAGEETPLSRNPVGTGPFRFVRWEPGVQIVMEANPGYFDGRPHLDRLIYRVVPDRHSIVVGLETGDLDVAGLNPLEAPPPDPSLPFEIIHYPAPMLDFILWNTREKPGLFVDARVRRAFSLAFDRKGYIDHVTEGQDIPAVSTFLPTVWAHDPNIAPLPYDPAAAARLLAEAGWKDRDGDGILDTPAGPASFTLLFYSGLPVAEKIATLVKESLEPLGVRVGLQGLDFPSLRERVRGHSFDAAVYRWTMDVDPDPYDFFHSSQAESGQNYGGYSNPEVDRLSEEGRRTLDLAGRAAIYHDLEKILREEQPYTFISHPTTALAVSRRLRGIEVGPRGFWGWYPAPLRWWIPTDQRRRHE